MPSSLVEKIKALHNGPLYVIRMNGVTYFIDKMTVDDRKKWKRTRYLSDGKTCTCLGFMKFEYCKHLGMVTRDIDIGTKGVEPQRVREEISHIVEILKELFPHDTERWEDALGKTLSVKAAGVVLIVKQAHKDLKALVYVKKIDGKTLTVLIGFGEK